MRFFFYGTLRDAEVRALVLATPPQELHVRRAVLPGYRRLAVKGARYPTLRRAVGGTVEGEVVSGLNRADAIRIFHFEGDAYALSRRSVRLIGGRSRSVWVCLPRSRIAVAGRWDLAHWQRCHKRQFLVVANRWMREFGVRRLTCHYPIRHLREQPPEWGAEARSLRRRRAAGR